MGLQLVEYVVVAPVFAVRCRVPALEQPADETLPRVDPVIGDEVAVRRGQVFERPPEHVVLVDGRRGQTLQSYQSC